MRDYGSRRMDRGSGVRTDSERTVQAVMRRLGQVTSIVHREVMAELIKRNDGSAETFNDWFKPVVDRLLHFTLEDYEDAPR